MNKPEGKKTTIRRYLINMLGLATLGGVPQIGISSICLTPPKVPEASNGSFTLAMFVSETVGDSDTCLYLPWPPCVT